MIDVAILRAAGLTDGQIVKVLETEQLERKATVREQNRIRQRNYRARNDVTRDQRDQRDTSPSEIAKEDVSAAGQEFWAKYPLKVGKRAAMQALERALKRASLADILAGVDRYKASANPDYYCHPTTWLNGDRWLDEPKLQRINKNGKGLAEVAHDLSEEWRDEFESDPGGSFDDERRS